MMIGNAMVKDVVAKGKEGMAVVCMWVWVKHRQTVVQQYVDLPFPSTFVPCAPAGYAG